MSQLELSVLSDKDYLTTVEVSSLLCIPETLIIEWIEHDVVYARYEQKVYYIASDQLNKIKSALRLANDLGVNAPGISIILALRQKVKYLEALVERK
ncbi:chaperone modulator CbpM [Fangia hongkongensis]|uniref:chaperone modulator CbpM n=1 Tax=Fangia hongkongensis TaxID=270495 RepID=UPI00035FD8A6|nr:chaperone modulator CbpM [Fangia hongkongensis]MBK2123912.1 hypothetical protein [Fangia hongkongensis]